LKVLYWFAVFAVSLALLVALVIFFESRDDAALDGGGGSSGALPLARPASATA